MSGIKMYSEAIVSIFLDPASSSTPVLVHRLRESVEKALCEVPESELNNILVGVFKGSVSSGVDLGTLSLFAALLSPLNSHDTFPMNELRDLCEEDDREGILVILEDFERKSK